MMEMDITHPLCIVLVFRLSYSYCEQQLLLVNKTFKQETFSILFFKMSSNLDGCQVTQPKEGVFVPAAHSLHTLFTLSPIVL